MVGPDMGPMDQAAAAEIQQLMHETGATASTPQNASAGRDAKPSQVPDRQPVNSFQEIIPPEEQMNVEIVEPDTEPTSTILSLGEFVLVPVVPPDEPADTASTESVAAPEQISPAAPPAESPPQSPPDRANTPQPGAAGGEVEVIEATIASLDEVTSPPPAESPPQSPPDRANTPQPGAAGGEVEVIEATIASIDKAIKEEPKTPPPPPPPPAQPEQPPAPPEPTRSPTAVSERLPQLPDNVKLLAKAVLEHSGITYDHPVNNRIRKSMEMAADTGNVPVRDLGGDTVPLNINLLRFILDAADAGIPIKISSIATGEHSDGSLHYSGNAVDIGNEEVAPRLMQFAFDNREAYGIDESFYKPIPELNLDKGKPINRGMDKANHIHLGFFPEGDPPVSQPAPAPSAQKPAPPPPPAPAQTANPEAAKQVTPEQTIWNYLIGKGLKPVQVAGIMGNLAVESGFKADINEINPVVKGSRGGYGIAQWTGGRRKQLEKFAEDEGKPVESLELQLEFMWDELNSTEKRALKHLRRQTSIRGATISFMEKYERPGKPHADKRIKAARAILAKFSG